MTNRRNLPHFDNPSIKNQRFRVKNIFSPQKQWQPVKDAPIRSSDKVRVDLMKICMSSSNSDTSKGLTLDLGAGYPRGVIQTALETAVGSEYPQSPYPER